MAKQTATAPRIFQVNTSTGPHAAGEVVEITDAHVAHGVDIDRLVNLGCLTELAQAPTGVSVTQLGQSADADRNAVAFPQAKPATTVTTVE